MIYREKIYIIAIPRKYVLIKKLKVGIAGYGVVGKRRRVHIDKNPNMQTICVSDITISDPVKLQDGVKYLNNYKDLFNYDLDVIFVSLPNYLAAEATIKGIENGCHVFCEKPPARTVSEVKNVIEVQQKYPELKIKYGFNPEY